MSRSRPQPHQVKKPWYVPEVPTHGKDQDLANLRLWVQDMVDWGERVHQDILDLEEKVDALRGVASAAGDPGDPPPKPE